MTIWRHFATPRFYGWSLLFAAVGAGFLYLPAQWKDGICVIYEKIRPSVEGAMSAGLRASTQPNPGQGGPGPEYLVVDESSIGDLERHVHRFLCEHGGSHETNEPTAPKPFEVAVFAIACGLLVCLLVPARPRKGLGPGIPGPINGERPTLNPSIINEFRLLAIRSAQSRVSLVYAILSGAASSIVHVAKYTNDGFFNSGNMAHIAAITMASVIAVVWGIQRPAVRHKDFEGFRIAFRIGFGGIFLGSLIALSLSLPYRVFTNDEGSALSMDVVQLIVLIRLGALPLVGWAVGLVSVATCRWLGNLPVNIHMQVR